LSVQLPISRRAAGFIVQGAEQSTAAIAAANETEPRAVIRVLLN
jgi:hypothetical protein